MNNKHALYRQTHHIMEHEKGTVSIYEKAPETDDGKTDLTRPKLFRWSMHYDGWYLGRQLEFECIGDFMQVVDDEIARAIPWHVANHDIKRGER